MPEQTQPPAVGTNRAESRSQPHESSIMTEPADGILERHEPAYAEWLTANPQGFVFLTRTNCMHRAGCRSVRPLCRPERWPSFWLGGGWVSRGVAPLDYALAAICESADRCTRCKPGSDPDGVAMMAGYLARLRGLESPLKAGNAASLVDSHRADRRPGNVRATL